LGGRRLILAGQRLILVDGPAGAGKTTFATGLADGLAVPLIHMDDLYLGWDGLEGAFGRLEDLVLGPWRAGAGARFSAYDWQAGGAHGPWVSVPGSAGRLVVEGCGCAPRAADRYSPLIVWLDGPAAWRRSNALERDGAWEAPYLDAWELATTAHHGRERTAARAHIRLNRAGNRG
jgi:hypothetical protein